VYLGFDRLGALGNTSAMATTAVKAQALVGNFLPAPCYFVELRRVDPALPLPTDTGWLYFFPDRLLFIGDEVAVVFPHSQIRESMTVKRKGGGLLGAWVEIGLQEPYRAVRCLPRNEIQRTSDSAEQVESLAELLRDWYRVGHEERHGEGRGESQPIRAV
jgi:hypothetical protein